MAETSGDVGDIFEDDESLSNDTTLLRRIPPGRTTKGTSDDRPRSDNYSNHPDGSGISVDIWEDGREPKDVLVDHEHFGLVQFTAGDVRSIGLGVVRAPVPGNPHHAHIQGKKTKSIKRKLAEFCIWIKKPKQDVI